MQLLTLITPFPWARYSKKLMAKIDNPRFGGTFGAVDGRGVRLVEGTAGTRADGNIVKLFWLVDLEDGVIADAKFQLFGQSALIGAAEAACELLIGKNYDQAKRIGADLLDRHLRDRTDEPAFPHETFPHLNLVISAIEEAAAKCTDIPLPTAYAAPPAPRDIGDVVEGGYPGWDTLSVRQKIAVIEEVVARDIRPYIELDAGGVDVINLLQGREVVIAYKGSCTSCFSATGATLSYIQHVLRAKVHPDLTVVPSM